MVRGSRFPLAVTSTWSGMLFEQFLEDFIQRLGVSRHVVGESLSDAFRGLPVVLPLLFKIDTQRIVKSGHRILTVPLRVVIQLGLA
jgi:hypothetical protein